MMMYLWIQLIFAYLNHRRNSRVMESDSSAKSVLLIVGRQEKQEYWSKCLESVRLLTGNLHLIRIYIVIDGDQDEDLYMKQEVERILYPTHFPIPISVYMISHRGKRGAMFFGFQEIQKEFASRRDDIDVMVTDSDTVIDPFAPTHLQQCLRSHDKNGCVTGTLYIYNRQDGLLPKMIHPRYQYAFQVERASASYQGCMTCCSGPISMYRLSLLHEMTLHRFITQSYFKVRCEPGDDRHLTNLILAMGYYGRQTNLASAGTEAPSDLFRFLKQQLRWSRSYYRELYWQWKSLPYQSHYLSIIMVYELCFPLFVSIWMFYSIYDDPHLFTFIKNGSISLGILIIRTITLFLYTRQLCMFYNLIYFPVYLCLLLPTKLFAMITLLNNRWETQYRNQLSVRFGHYCSFHFISILLWNIALIYPLIRFLITIFPSWIDQIKS